MIVHMMEIGYARVINAIIHQLKPSRSRTLLKKPYIF